MASDIGVRIGIDGEKQFREELKNITQQGKTLSAQMDALSASFDKADNKEAALDKATKNLNAQIENQKKKVDLLAEAVQKSAEVNGEDANATLKLKEQLAKAEKGLSDLEKKTVGATDETKEFGKTADSTSTDVKELGEKEEDASKKTSRFGDVLKASLLADALKAGLKALANGVKKVADYFVDATKNAADYSDEILELASTTSMSTDALQEYKYMAPLIDTELNTITGSLTKLTKSMSSAKDGSKASVEAFEALGVSVTDAEGNLRSTNDVFDDAINALGQIQNEAERDALAMQIFGKSAKDLNPLIEAGADKLAALRKEAHDTGYVLSGETLDSMGAVKDGFDRLGLAAESVKNQIGAAIGKAVLPYLEKLVGAVQKITGGSKDFEAFGKTIADTAGKFITDAVNKLTSAAPRIAEVAGPAALQIVQSLLDSLSKNFPKILKAGGELATKLASGLEKAIPMLFEKVGDLIGQIIANTPKLIEYGTKIAGSLVKGILEGIPKLLKGVYDGLKGLFSTPISEDVQIAQNELDELKKSLEGVGTETEEMFEGFRKADTAAREAEYWLGIFDKLKDKTQKTAGEQALLNKAVDELNGIIPNLGLKIDEETGKWNLNTSEIRANIKAMVDRARAEVYYDKIKADMEQLIELEGQLGDEQAKLNKLMSNRDAISTSIELNAALTREANTIKTSGSNLVTQWNSASDALRTYAESVGVTTDNFYGWDQVIGYLTEDQIGLKKELKDANTLVGIQKDKVETLEGGIQGLNAEIDDFSNKAQNALKAAEKVGNALGDGVVKGIKAKYKEIRQAAGDASSIAIKAMKDVAQIQSPSKVARKEVGQMIGEGVILGMRDETHAAEIEAQHFAESLLMSAKETAEKLQKQSKLSSAEWVTYWKRYLSEFQKGTKEYKAASKELVAARKQLQSDVAGVTKTYVEGVEKVNRELDKNIAALEDAYAKSVESRANNIVSSLKLFSDVQLDEALTKQQLEMNLQNQVAALREWDDVLVRLQNRLGAGSPLLKELEEMGVSALGTLRTLDSMSNTELTSYAALYADKLAIANERALTENEQLLKETNAAIAQLQKDAKKSVKALQNTYLNELAELGVTVGEQSEEIGKQVTAGIAAGFKEGADGMNAVLKAEIQGMIDAIKEQLGISSPSKVFAQQVGRWLPPGISEGFDLAMPGAENDMQSALNAAIAGMRSDIVFGSMSDLFAGGDAGGAGSAGSTVTNNMGGISITINARDDQSANEIADVVMRKMQAAVNSKKAVFA